MCLKAALCFIVIAGSFLSVAESLKANDTGVCTAKISVRKTRQRTYPVTINKWCGKKKCTVKRTKTEGYTVTKKQNVCCSGFKYRSETDSCSPLCSTGCVGGRCIAPDVCVCDPPSTLGDNNTCISPTCEPPCINAECNTNNTCVCNSNFTSYNSTHCYRCDPGFTINENFICSPTCSTPCVNGKCTAPNTCSCSEGYSKIDQFTCAPSCESCVNSKCVSPNTCDCYDGYEKFNLTTCVPNCEKCTNGRCVAPNVCECNAGYKRTVDVCEPLCDVECVNGFCSAPNTCSCKEGYVKNGTSQTCSKLCPVGSYNVSGHCIPENCASVKK